MVEYSNVGDLKTLEQGIQRAINRWNWEKKSHLQLLLLRFYYFQRVHSVYLWAEWSH